MSKMGFICCFVLLGCLNLKAATLYVDLSSTASVSPYTDWTSAATNIQDAVDAAVAGDTVIVTNGHYLLAAEILVSKEITLRSVNGPENTVVDGQGSVRCFKLGSAACLVDGLTITNGYSSSYGGGVYCGNGSPVITNCIVIGNRAILYGGGIYKGTAENCTIRNNSSGRYGGGMSDGTADSCFICENTAESRGGGIYQGTANNCTIIGNSAEGDGGGMYRGTANNCIVWNNAASAGSDLQSTTSFYSCSPDVTHGVNGNITNAPLLSASFTMTSDSPCYGAGSRDYVSGTDFNGDVWLYPPSMGCDELDQAVGNLAGIRSNSSVAPVDGVVSFNVQMEGAASSLQWDFGGGETTNNCLSVDHIWSNLGDYDVLLTVYNTDWPSGVTVTQTISVLPKEQLAIHVAPTGNDANDGLSWATAKATVQAGVDAQIFDDCSVLISNGTYAVSNQVVLNKPIVVRGINGPESTIIDGQGIVRCFDLGNTSSVIDGLTITNGYTKERGGGIYCADSSSVITNCIITGNRTTSYGGGIYQGTVENCAISNNSATRDGGGIYSGMAVGCIISGNTAGGYGGGVYQGSASNCTIVENSAVREGGGMYRGTANNSIVWGNAAPTGNDLRLTKSYYSCSPDMTHGVNGNITNAPLLSASFTMTSDSPCYGAGSRDYVTGTDIDGDAWLFPPSMGCDELEPAVGNLGLEFGSSSFVTLVGGSLPMVLQIEGAASSLSWDYADETTDADCLSAEHVWNSPGEYNVIVTAYNSAWPDGVSVTQTVSVLTKEQATIHVAPSGNDANDGYSWATAKATIQSGIDAQIFDECSVLVSNGTYALTNEVLVNKAIVVRSVNGPESTIVDGQGSVRCFYLDNSACVIEGLTITNGYTTDYGGGILCQETGPVVTNCTISGNVAGYGGGMAGGTANNCVIIGNEAGSRGIGGGLNESIANNCTIRGNTAYGGGGMASGSANNCIFLENTADWGGGGGSLNSEVNNCYFERNFAATGGASNNDTLNNCTLTGNMAYRGGGSHYSTVNNCVISGNIAADYGGGSYEGTLNNCTLSGNSADVTGGGSYLGTLNNCIVYANTAFYSDNNWFEGTFSYCCTTPLPEGEGNISEDPMLLGSSHIYSESPCVGAGAVDYVSATDIDGDAWALAPSIGCDEPTAPCDGLLSVAILKKESTIIAGYTLDLSADITGVASSNQWAFGDGTILLNATYPEHAWSAAGDYEVVLTAWNDDYPEGISVTSLVQVVDSSIHYVDAGNASPVAPYDSWATAATNIQDAVDAASETLGSLVLVTNGYYTAGGAITPGYECMNRVVITNDITVQSVNGPEYTYIVGEGPLGSNAVRGVYMSSGVLSGFTITNGHTMTTGYIYYDCIGGGVNLNGGDGPTISGGDGFVTNCVIVGNVSYDAGGGSYKGSLSDCVLMDNTAGAVGGGSYVSMLNNCTISGNSAASYGGGLYYGVANNSVISGNSSTSRGGGASGGTLNNCTISGNSAGERGGGIYNSTVNNSIVWNNEAPTENDLSSAIARFTCSPDVTHGVDGNITNAPLLTADGHVAWNSPCRGAGNMGYATGTDIDGEAWGNPPSIGCDEYHGEGEDWLQVLIESSDTIVPNGFPLSFQRYVEGLANLVIWDFDDGTFATNSFNESHIWDSPGTYAVTLTAYSDVYHPTGISATQTIQVVTLAEVAMHVAVDGDDTNDGASWATAKRTIQAGVDALDIDGGWVLVSNGTYAVTNEIVVNKALLIKSVNGPASTVVDGQGSVRCFNLGNTACVIEGLTITNGYTSVDGGGIYCSGIIPVVTNCTISGNAAIRYGGGMYKGTANNCTISGNTASYDGGALSESTANNCTISDNSARNGGALYKGTANSCTIIGNSASNDGGGMSGSTANNCAVSGNLASRDGGGMYAGTANNCTISGNAAVRYGGGMRGGTANNCIVWYDTAPSGKDLYSTTVSYSCSPDVTHGVDGNITNAPVFVSSSHIAADSPCRGTGSADYATGTDIDGEAWTNPPSMGCDEPADFPRGPIEVSFIANKLIEFTGYSIQFKEQIRGALSEHVWDFGDGTRVTNSSSVEHAWGMSGTFNVVLTAYNADWPAGVSSTQEVSIISFEETAIHVSPSGNDANDGTSWTSAKATIQAGIDEQDLTGGWILVGSGTYSLSETITVSKPVRILSVDGPGSTIVDGQGNDRCFNLGNTACVIEGLTITNGYAGYGGGICCSGIVPIVTNCTISGNRTSGSGGGMYKGTANNCTISGNRASRFGGGMGYGKANNCIISGNTAGELGGGMSHSTANDCTISGNRAGEVGGGMNASTANNCTVSGNMARDGGGMSSCTANNCTVIGNTASRYGGGTYAFIANNCTVIGNTSSQYGGGMYEGTANNCIVWYNTSPSGKDLYNTTARYSCSPEVTHGANGNITNAPLFTISSRIAADSPCRGAGSTDYATGTDMDGEAWANPPSMGCDEPYSTTGGDITVSFTSSENKVLPGEMIAFKGMVEGAALMYVWDFCDGTQVTNSLSVEHVWAALGTYDVVLTAYNGDWLDGVSATQDVSIVSLEGSAIHVSPTGSDANDGTSWESAKATIQAGVDAQDLRDGWILIDGGTYSLSTMITVSNPVHIVGVDGPESTIVDGQGSVRCFNLGNTVCVIEGLTITNGYSSGVDGGGIYCSGIVPVVTNCTISGNSARNGGGMYRGTAINCTISGNSATEHGGGMYEGTANGCIILGNSAIEGVGSGGGMYHSTANNCTIRNNSAAALSGGMHGGTANNCIIWYNSGKNLHMVNSHYSCSPDVVHGIDGNITNAPILISFSHVSTNSPCIGAGSAEYAVGVDIDGETWQTPPSMGCDEYTGSVTGALKVSMVIPSRAVVQHSQDFVACIDGSPSLIVWDFDDGIRVTNSLYAEHSWEVLGNYDVVLTAFNDTWPDGVSATQSIEVISAEENAIYVSPDGDDANDGLSWATAKATVQAGVDAQQLPGGWVTVSNGTYTLTQTISIDKEVVVRSVHSPESTIINGGGVVNCLYLGDVTCVIDGLTITNGYNTYAGGGINCSSTTPMVTNCIISGNYASRGGGMFRGTANNCIISGNDASDYGGGIWSGTANNCTIIGNSANNGGGLHECTANNCTIIGNSAVNYGGGMYYGTANNCTISDNSASLGGGVSQGIVNNCIISSNSASDGGGMYSGTANNCTISGNTSTLQGGGIHSGTAKNTIVYGNTSPKGNNFYLSSANYTCSPDLTHGVNGNITAVPLFVDAANGDYRLAAGSPCIDAGYNGYIVGSLDLAGLPRIVGGVVDMGAYEYQGEVSGDLDEDGLPDDWEQDCFSSLDATADGNNDGDAFDNLEEYIAGTDPTDAASCFAITNCCLGDGFTVEWSPSVTGRLYRVIWNDSLINSEPIVLQDNIEYPQSSYTDLEYNGETNGFYRVEVRLP